MSAGRSRPADPGIQVGLPVRLSAEVVRITAPNPGVMTGPGTNTYIVGGASGIVIDPGPAIEVHQQAVLAAAGGHISRILCTHTHLDHSPGAQWLQARTGATLVGRPGPSDGRHDAAFQPTSVLNDGDVVEHGGLRLRALHTPGHDANHLCYLLEPGGMLFTGDHIMQGSTVVITPPDGDMGAYLKSLERLLDEPLNCLAPGHGTLIETPQDEVRKLIGHRLKREAKVVAALKAETDGTLPALVKIAYDDAPERLHAIAQRSLHAHLLKLAADGVAVDAGGAWRLR